MHSVLLSVLVLASIPVLFYAQNNSDEVHGIRCGYHFIRHSGDENKRTTYYNMRLDFLNNKSVFYDEYSFVRDSLRILAFDENGKTKNQDEYNKMTSLPRPRLEEYTIFDYDKGFVSQCYKKGVISMRGEMQMNMPSWAITEDVDTIDNYVCKKAIANYLGRTWIVWYTEALPFFIGPWMLWGAPGLIIYAEDSDLLFSFKLVWIEPLSDDSRICFINSRLPDSMLSYRGYKHYFHPIRYIEQMNQKISTDDDYLYELMEV